MDFETFIDALLRFLKSGDNAYFVMYAVATCALSQVAKKLFVNKVKVDVLHKFDFAVVLPFIFGAVFAVLDVFCFKRVRCFTAKVIVDVVVNAAAIGALASAIFKLASSISGNKLSRLLSDDVFAMFYTQLMYYGNVREQLLSKTLTFKSFLDQVKLVAANALDIYKTEDSEEIKRQNLAKLLAGVIADDAVNTCVNVLHKALIAYVERTNKTDKQKNA